MVRHGDGREILSNVCSQIVGRSSKLSHGRDSHSDSPPDSDSPIVAVSGTNNFNYYSNVKMVQSHSVDRV